MTIKLCCQCQTPITGGVYSSHDNKPCHLNCDPNMPDYRERALRARVKKAEAERDTAWNDAIEAAANSVKSHAEIARRKMRESYDLGADRKVVDCWSAIISHMDNEGDTIRSLRKGEPT